MNHQDALYVLGLPDGATAAEIKAAVTEKNFDLEDKMSVAPTDALKDKFQTMLDKVTEAEQVLSQSTKSKSRSPLSETKMADLPGMAPATTGSQLKVGDTLSHGRYEIKAAIAEGGMGAVYRAYDKSRDEDIAIKVMLPHLMQHESARERFLNEARLSSKLSHPNIVNVYDVQEDDGYFFLTMELLEGQELRDLMENRKLVRDNFTEQDVLEILTPICAALDYAHKFTVHRDIKPENIYLTEDGEYKLMDFGIARVMSTTQRTQTGAASGTAYYMAPEQLKGAKDIDGRADQYALAVLVYELLSNEVPAGAIEPLHELVKGVSRKVSNAVQKALSPRPKNRFETLSEFLNAIQGQGKPKLKKVRETQSSENNSPSTFPIRTVAIIAGLVLLVGGGTAVNNYYQEQAMLAETERVKKEQVARIESERKKKEEAARNKLLNVKMTAEMMTRGQKVYRANCAACHQANGTGGGPFPALKGSEFVTRPITEHLAIIKNGIRGTSMSGFGRRLSTLDIAAVTTYIRNAWGNDTGDFVQASDVNK